MNPRVPAYIQFAYTHTSISSQVSEGPYFVARAYASEGMGESVILSIPLKHDVCVNNCAYVLMYARICDHVCPCYAATHAFGYKMLDRNLVYVSGRDH